MIVDDAADGGFVCGRQRTHRLHDIVIDERLELGRLIAGNERIDQEKELRLTLAEVAHEVDEQADVPLLLAYGDGRRVVAGARPPRRGRGAVNLYAPGNA